MTRTNFEKLEVYRLSEQLADEVWTLVEEWPRFARVTVGRPIVRPADSVGANIAEGVGRGSYRDNRRFVKIARGSLYETKHWLRRAYQRNLLSQEQVDQLKPVMDELAPRLNAYLNSIGKTEHGSSRKTTDDEPRTTNYSERNAFTGSRMAACNA